MEAKYSLHVDENRIVAPSVSKYWSYLFFVLVLDRKRSAVDNSTSWLGESWSPGRPYEHTDQNVEFSTIGSVQKQHYSKEISAWCFRKPHLIIHCGLFFSLYSWLWVLEAAVSGAWHQPRGNPRRFCHKRHGPQRCILLSGRKEQQTTLMNKNGNCCTSHISILRNVVSHEKFCKKLCVCTVA